MRTRIVAMGAALALSTLSAIAQASGVASTRSSLPKGPASIEGSGRSYALSYDNSDSHSRLLKVRMTGTDGATATPDSSFECTKPSFAAVGQITAMTTPPGALTSDKDGTPADLNGDSLPDLLVGKTGAFMTYVNHDGTSWKAASNWASSNSHRHFSRTRGD